MKITLPKGRLVVLLPVLALAAYLAVFGDKTPQGAAKAAVPLARPTAAAAALARAPQVATNRKLAVPLERIEAVMPRGQLMSAASAPSANLFASPTWSARPQPALAPAQPLAAQPVPPAVPSYRVLGKKLENDSWEVYLGRDDSSVIVRAGDTLDGTWRIDAIDPPSMLMTHLPSGAAQSLAIGDSR